MKNFFVGAGISLNQAVSSQIRDEWFFRLISHGECCANRKLWVHWIDCKAKIWLIVVSESLGKWLHAEQRTFYMLGNVFLSKSSEIRFNAIKRIFVCKGRDCTVKRTSPDSTECHCRRRRNCPATTRTFRCLKTRNYIASRRNPAFSSNPLVFIISRIILSIVEQMHFNRIDVCVRVWINSSEHFILPVFSVAVNPAHVWIRTVKIRDISGKNRMTAIPFSVKWRRRCWSTVVHRKRARRIVFIKNIFKRQPIRINCQVSDKSVCKRNNRTCWAWAWIDVANPVMEIRSTEWNWIFFINVARDRNSYAAREYFFCLAGIFWKFSVKSMAFVRVRIERIWACRTRFVTRRKLALFDWNKAGDCHAVWARIIRDCAAMFFGWVKICLSLLILVLFSRPCQKISDVHRLRIPQFNKIVRIIEFLRIGRASIFWMKFLACKKINQNRTGFVDCREDFGISVVWVIFAPQTDSVIAAHCFSFGGKEKAFKQRQICRSVAVDSASVSAVLCSCKSGSGVCVPIVLCGRNFEIKRSVCRNVGQSKIWFRKRNWAACAVRFRVEFSVKGKRFSVVENPAVFQSRDKWNCAWNFAVWIFERHVKTEANNWIRNGICPADLWNGKLEAGISASVGYVLIFSRRYKSNPFRRASRTVCNFRIEDDSVRDSPLFFCDSRSWIEQRIWCRLIRNFKRTARKIKSVRVKIFRKEHFCSDCREFCFESSRSRRWFVSQRFITKVSESRIRAGISRVICTVRRAKKHEIWSRKINRASRNFPWISTKNFLPC